MNSLLYIDPQSAAFVLVGILIICLFVSGIFYFKAKHNEKMLLIEKGLTDSPLQKSSGNFLQKVGIIVIAVSIGILMVTLFSSVLGFADGTDVAIIGISGGLGMIYANHLNKKS